MKKESETVEVVSIIKKEDLIKLMELGLEISFLQRMLFIHFTSDTERRNKVVSIRLENNRLILETELGEFIFS